MPAHGLLKVPLLLRHICIPEADAANDKVERCDEAAPAIQCRSSLEFIDGLRGTAMLYSKDGKNCEAANSAIAAKVGSDDVRVLRLEQEWIFASPSSPEGTGTWYAMKTDRLDCLLQTWSRATSYFVASDRAKGQDVGLYFFPTRLPGCIPPSTNRCSDGTYFEVRVRIPIRLVHVPLRDNDRAGFCADDLSETLEEFAASGRMYTRRLRLLLHNAVLSFMSGTLQFADLPICLQKLGGETCSASLDDNIIDEDSPISRSSSSGSRNNCCRKRTRNLKAMHQFLPCSLAASAAPVPVAFSVGVAKDCDNLNADDGTAGGETTPAEGKAEEMGILLDVGTVVHLTHYHIQTKLRWTPDCIAFEVLTSLFPTQFSLHDAVSIEVGEVNWSSGVVSEWLKLSSAAVLEAKEQVRDAKAWVRPALKPLEPLISSPLMNSTASNTIKKQHDPYSVLTWTPTHSETPVMDIKRNESTGEIVDMSGCTSSSQNSSARTQVLEEKIDTPCNFSQTPNLNSDVTAKTETVALEVGEEEEGVLLVKDVKKVVVDLAEDFAASRTKSTELLHALQNQLSFLTPLHTAEKCSSPRPKKRQSSLYARPLASALLPVLHTFLGVPTGAAGDEGVVKHAVAEMVRCAVKGPSRYADINEIGRDMVSIAQKLEDHLRAEAEEVMCVHQGSVNYLAESVTRKACAKENGAIPLFASAVEKILQGGYQRESDEDPETMLRFTAAVLVEARHSIDQACENLRVAAGCGRQHVAVLQRVQQMCQDVFIPCAETRIALEKREGCERSQLKIVCTRSETLLLEKHDAMRIDEQVANPAVIDVTVAEDAAKCDVLAVSSGEEEMVVDAVLEVEGKEAGGQVYDGAKEENDTSFAPITAAVRRKKKVKKGVVHNAHHSAVTTAAMQQPKTVATTRVGDGGSSRGIGSCTVRGKKKQPLNQLCPKSLALERAAQWRIFSVVVLFFAIGIMILLLP